MAVNYADGPCDLECEGNVKGARHEFVGPVRIVLIEASPEEYKRKVCASGIVSAAMMIMGLAIFPMALFTLTLKLPSEVKLHVVLCSFGFLFMICGIMMFSTLFSVSVFMKPAHRKFMHLMLQLGAGASMILGAFFVFEGFKITIHGISGYIGAILIVLSTLVGPTVYFSSGDKIFGKFNRKAHRFFAVPAFIACAVCFMCGLMEPSFTNWTAIRNFPYMLLAITIFFCGTVLYSIAFKRVQYGRSL